MNIRALLTLAAGLLLIASSASAADPLGTARSSKFSGELSVETVVRKNGVITVRSLVKNSDKKKSNGVEDCNYAYLLDPEKGVKYEALKDEKGYAIGSASVYVPEEGSLPIWCKFPAPPNEVKVIGYVHTGFEAIEDLPITDK